jgi:hypothetical protein
VYESSHWNDTAISEVAFYDDYGKINIILGDYRKYLKKLSCDSVKTHLYKIYKNEKWGFIERSGAVIIRPQFVGVLNFSEGRAQISDGELMGYINISGKTVIPVKYNSTMPFRNGKAKVTVYGKTQSDPYTDHIIDKNGNILKSTPYMFQADEGILGSTELIPFKENGKWGYKYKFIDNSTPVIKPVYDQAFDFKNGYAIVIKNGKHIVISEAGQIISYPIFKKRKNIEKKAAVINKKFIITNSGDVYTPKKFNEGLAAISINGKYGYINNNFEVVIPPLYDHAYEFQNGLARIILIGEYGFINKHGENVVSPVFEFLRPFKENRAAFRKTISRKRVRWGFVDRKGDIAVNAEYSIVEDYYHGLALVWAGKKKRYFMDTSSIGEVCAYIDKNGKIIWAANRGEFEIFKKHH